MKAQPLFNFSWNKSPSYWNTFSRHSVKDPIKSIDFNRKAIISPSLKDQLHQIQTSSSSAITNWKQGRWQVKFDVTCSFVSRLAGSLVRWTSGKTQGRRPHPSAWRHFLPNLKIKPRNSDTIKSIPPEGRSARITFSSISGRRGRHWTWNTWNSFSFSTFVIFDSRSPSKTDAPFSQFYRLKFNKKLRNELRRFVAFVFV